MVNARHRGIRRPTARAFSLLELILVLMLVIVLLAGYIRALDEAESIDDLIRGDNLPRLARAGQSAAFEPPAAAPAAPTPIASANTAAATDLPPNGEAETGAITTVAPIDR